MNRFISKKVVIDKKVDGWRIGKQEVFAVIDTMWDSRLRNITGFESKAYDGEYYIKFTECKNEKLAQAIAQQLNRTIGENISKHIDMLDGHLAREAVLRRDLGNYSPAENPVDLWISRYGL